MLPILDHFNQFAASMSPENLLFFYSAAGPTHNFVTARYSDSTSHDWDNATA